MKILIFQDYLRSGGTERQSVFLANAFAKEGHETSLTTFRPRGPLASTIAPEVTHHVLQPFDTRCDWFAPGLCSYIEENPADIILCMGRMANCYGQGIMKEVQDRWPNTAVIGTMRTGKPLPWLFRFSLKHVHHIVANSRAAKSHLETRYSIDPTKISVVANSLVFTEPPSADIRSQLRATHGADENTTVLLDVAMFRPEKNQRALIEIAAKLPADFPWQLWLVGDGAALESCKTLAKKLAVTDRVKFHGLRSNPTPYYAAADLAVHASQSESLSNFLIEAQAHGLPAIAYAAQGVDECFLPDDTGISIPLGEQAPFRDAIQQLASPDEARRERARTFAHNSFDPRKQVKAYLDLFARLTSS